FLSCIIRSLGAFPVHRGSGDTQAINNAELLLKAQKVLGIFIEGTRSKTGELLRPKSGAAMLAFQTHTPVVPACISCRGGKMPKIFRKITISYGEPLTPEELGLKEGTAQEFRNASRKIMDIIRTMREKDIQETN
ncbi:MAG: lysophospholipid acyltransferase family protein, partial [Clostridium sp.]